MNNFLQEQDVLKSYRILGIGATTLVGAAHNCDVDYMAAAWAGVCDYDKGYAVIAGDHYTRKLIAQSGRFILCYPTVSIVDQVMKLGSISKNDDPDKLEHAQVELIKYDGFNIPLVKGCAAYLEYEVIQDQYSDNPYEMVFGKCVKVVSDSQVYHDNHWDFDNAPDKLRTLHYVAGGHFFAIGKEIVLPEYGD